MTTRSLAPLFLVLALATAGCSLVVIAPPFRASNTLSKSGNVAVGNVRYLPAESHAVREDQLTGFKAVYIDTAVANYVSRALRLELERSGLNPTNAAIFVDCDVLRFGFNEKIMWNTARAELSFRLRARPTLGTPVERSYEFSQVIGSNGGFEDIRGLLNLMITRAYEQFLKETEVRTLIEQSASLSPRPSSTATPPATVR